MCINGRAEQHIISSYEPGRPCDQLALTRTMLNDRTRMGDPHTNPGTYWIRVPTIYINGSFGFSDLTHCGQGANGNSYVSLHRVKLYS